MLCMSTMDREYNTGLCKGQGMLPETLRAKPKHCNQGVHTFHND